MDALQLVALVAASAAIAGLARRTPVPAPLLLVAAGLAASYVPGVPDYTLDPHIVLPLILPPLLYTAAVDSSYLDLRANIRPVALLSVGYVLFATVAVSGRSGTRTYASQPTATVAKRTYPTESSATGRMLARRSRYEESTAAV